jgi:hypothetical protein
MSSSVTNGTFCLGRRIALCLLPRQGTKQHSIFSRAPGDCHFWLGLNMNHLQPLDLPIVFGLGIFGDYVGKSENVTHFCGYLESKRHVPNRVDPAQR